MAGASPICAQRFSTDATAPADRYAMWRERNGGLAQLHDTRPHGPFSANAIYVPLGTVVAAQSEMSSQTWQRTAAMARADGVDLLSVNIRTRGGAVGEADGTAFCGAGDTVILSDLSRPMVHVSEASQTALLLVPRVRAEAVVGPVRALHGAVLSGPGATLLRDSMRTLFAHVEHMSAADGDRMAGVMLDLLGVAVSMNGRPVMVTTAAVDRATRQHAEAMIEAELASARLGIARLCRRLGVSRSTLYRVFRDEGGVVAYIRDRRLARVHVLLGDASVREPVGTLAEAWGFCDAPHFGRLFRARYGMSPGEYRAMRAAMRHDGS
ncbi:helix-turn-helix domain-containing protein [Sphingomonas sp.]|uniref:helix-turn-helix domain-containing protein n=1 Tax=Sphingomonas sp. TaxID=28214 RepID=UPI001EB6826B|nr:helix-turn-helix domain-containing protein [Sphingomonas sp.]MBX3594673.1 helix-turn-helix domain-containing protein [Sphingomonas sp.]